MENLKIRITTTEESERAQRAFFALGGKWIKEKDQRIRITWAKYLQFVEWLGGYVIATVADYNFEKEIHREITLQELEEIAAKAIMARSESLEIMVEESEAQKRYDAAMEFLEKQTTGFYNSENQLIYLEDCVDVQQALRIAAGLE